MHVPRARDEGAHVQCARMGGMGRRPADALTSSRWSAASFSSSVTSSTRVDCVAIADGSDDMAACAAARSMGVSVGSAPRRAASFCCWRVDEKCSMFVRMSSEYGT